MELIEFNTNQHGITYSVWFIREERADLFIRGKSSVTRDCSKRNDHNVHPFIQQVAITIKIQSAGS